LKSFGVSIGFSELNPEILPSSFGLFASIN